jgi:hypothetical protein
VNRHFLTHLDEEDIGALNRIFSKILDAEDKGFPRDRLLGTGRVQPQRSRV